MKRSGVVTTLLATAIAVGFLFVIEDGMPSAAAARPAPTPTPVAIQYDEITKAYLAPATPAPPGTFHTDYRAIMASVPANAVAAATPTPSPGPRKRGMFGNLGALASMASGHIPGPSGDTNSSDAYAQAMGRVNAMRNGTLTRYTYYWLKGWVRIDDPVARTATIEKCNLHQFINLDLAHKTYTITDTQPQSLCNPQPGGSPFQGRSQNLAPGTVDLTVTNTGRNLGPMTIEGIGTTGNSSKMELSMANATGSCRSENVDMSKVEYISRIGKQRAYCPLPATMPSDPTALVARGGCKPTIHGSASGFASNDASFLAMYRLITMGTGNGQHMSNLLERGNFNWYYKPQADALFSIPPGFTQATP